MSDLSLVVCGLIGGLCFGAICNRQWVLAGVQALLLALNLWINLP